MSAVTVHRSSGVALASFARPVLSGAVLAELERCLESLAREAVPTPLVLRSAHPNIYLAGADLAEIAALDARSCADYARRGRAVLERLASHPAPTVAAVHGSCSGGGFDLVLACDWIVAGGTATFSHPGVRRGLVTGWGGTVRLPAAIGRTAAGGAILGGFPISSHELAARGVAAVADGDPVEAAMAAARRIAAVHATRLLLWRFAKSLSSPWLVAARAIIGSAAAP